MNEAKGKRDNWSGSLGFILAAAGSAIGLGNVWKFPYITGMNGGGAFVLVYLGCVLLVGLPIMLCEFTLGRHTQQSPVGAFQKLCNKSARNVPSARLIGLLVIFAVLGMICFGSYGYAALLAIFGILIFRCGWVSVGIVSVFSAATILGYYAVAGGWTITYIFRALGGGLNFVDKSAAQEYFKSIAGDPLISVSAQVGFMLICGLVVWFGIRRGIERVSKILMPILLFMLFILIIRGLTLPNAMGGVQFLLTPDFSKLSTEGALVAMGHAFYTLSLGMGISITYGSYLDRQRNIFLSSLAVIGLDTLIALMAGLAIFPALFAMNMDAQEGPGLVFQVMPMVFSALPDQIGWLWCAIFFLLLAIAAVTSGISLLEVCVTFCIDQFRWERRLATLCATLVISAFGIFCALSVQDWKYIPWLQQALFTAFGEVRGNFFDVVDVFNSNYLLPLAGISTSIFVGWIWGTRRAVNEIRHGANNFADIHIITLLAGLKNDGRRPATEVVWTLASLWGIFIRFITPSAIVITFLHAIGWLKLGA